MLPSALLIIVEHVLSDVLPFSVVCGDVVDALLQALVSPPAGVEEQAKHQHWEGGGGVAIEQVRTGTGVDVFTKCSIN